MTSESIVRIFDDVTEVRRFILRNRRLESMELPPVVQAGVRAIFGEDLTASDVVDRILADVRRDGDAALRHYTTAIDGASIDALEVTPDEFSEAMAAVP
ncbi:MAG TPA: histidinol dehydrogenase, partial [Nitrolancea sp.]|nr:histidinol dehydrogenase [Nitrolancea sp.]